MDANGQTMPNGRAQNIGIYWSLGTGRWRETNYPSRGAQTASERSFEKYSFKWLLKNALLWQSKIIHGRLIIKDHYTFLYPFVFLHKLHPYTMSESAVTIRVRKFMRNPLLKRRQMVFYDSCCLCVRPLRWFTPSAPLSPRRRLRLTSARSTTWRTIRPSSSSVSRLLSVLALVMRLFCRRWQIYWFCPDLRLPQRRQEVRGQVPSG